MRQPCEQIREGRRTESIHIGGVTASDRPMIVRTVLGSCIAVCLMDPISRVGGMNHFMLPRCSAGSANPTNYGIHAMELLINKCMNLGAVRSRLQAKVFGGGHVLNIRSTNVNVAKHNIEFAKEFLRTESIKVVSHDVGGYAAREVFFFTDTGKVLIHRFQETGLSEEMRAEINEPAPEPTANPASDDNVTLF